LDEPEANLDVDAAAAAVAVLKDVARSKRLLLLTHDARFASVADRVLRFGSDRCLHDLLGVSEASIQKPSDSAKAG
jgi:ABC-type lipoprotein export system ATPase subunit